MPDMELQIIGLICVKLVFDFLKTWYQQSKESKMENDISELKDDIEIIKVWTYHVDPDEMKQNHLANLTILNSLSENQKQCAFYLYEIHMNTKNRRSNED